MDPKIQEAIKSTCRYASAKGLKSFLLGLVVEAHLVSGQKGSQIILHREHLTVKQALTIAIQSVHTVMDWELDTPDLSPEERRVIEGFKDDMNKLVRATDKALIAAQGKRK